MDFRQMTLEERVGKQNRDREVGWDHTRHA
jgi:hypothetical protein